jgi:DNA-binding XRE family transcriptional regulator
MMEFVYMVTLKNKEAFKIGRSRDPQARIAYLNKFYEFDLEQVYWTGCHKESGYGARLEKTLHFVFSENRVLFEHDGGSEFFRYSVYDRAREMMKELAELHGNSIEELSLAQQIRDSAVDDNEVDLLLEGLMHKSRCRRLELNMTQHQLSRITGLGRSTIKNLETKGITTLRNFIKIMKALDMDHVFSEWEAIFVERKRATK